MDTLVNNISKLIPFLNQETTSTPIIFPVEKKPAAYKSINTSSISIFNDKDLKK